MIWLYPLYKVRTCSPPVPTSMSLSGWSPWQITHIHDDQKDIAGLAPASPSLASMVTFKSDATCNINSNISFTTHSILISGITSAFLGRVAHSGCQNEEENGKSLRKNKKNWSKFDKRMRELERLPTWDCEAGYGPDFDFDLTIYSCYTPISNNGTFAGLMISTLWLVLFS